MHRDRDKNPCARRNASPLFHENQVSPIVRMPAEEFSARALGGSLRAKSLEEAEAEEVWNLGSTALMREDTLSPSPSEVLQRGTSSELASAPGAAADDDDDAAGADYADVTARGPADDSGKDGGMGASGDNSDGGGTGSARWREIRDRALAANGGSFTNSRRLAANAAGSQGSKVEFKRRCVALSAIVCETVSYRTAGCRFMPCGREEVGRMSACRSSWCAAVAGCIFSDASFFILDLFGGFAVWSVKRGNEASCALPPRCTPVLATSTAADSISSASAEN